VANNENTPPEITPALFDEAILAVAECAHIPVFDEDGQAEGACAVCIARRIAKAVAAERARCLALVDAEFERWWAESQAMRMRANPDFDKLRGAIALIEDLIEHPIDPPASTSQPPDEKGDSDDA
jgi:hypothetical protein